MLSGAAQTAALAALPQMAEALRHSARVGDLEEVIRIVDEEVPRFGVSSINYRENGVGINRRTRLRVLNHDFAGFHSLGLCSSKWAHRNCWYPCALGW